MARLELQVLIDHIKTACDVDPWAQEAAEKLLERMKPSGIEIEGGGSTWWYTCEECHGQVDSSDKFCRHCGRPLINEAALGKEVVQ